MAGPGHPHSHPHHGARSGGRTLAGALLITAGFAVIEALGGWLAGSLALLGDAGHMITDATALGLATLAAWISRLPPTRRHSYGLQRAEIIAALINGLFMLGVVSAIVVSAIDRLETPRPVHGAAVIGVAGLGLLVNLGVAWLLARGEHTLNVRGALLHVIGDVLGSVAALASGLVVYTTGWLPIDPLLSLLICVLILYSAVRLLWDVMHVIMEGVPRHLDLADVGRAMAAVAEVREVHDLHIWTLSSGVIALSAHVVIDDLGRWDAVLERLRTLLETQYGIGHITLQPEPAAQVIQPMARRDRRAGRQTPP
ncbi:MAG: cation transporter [Gammaproteobacteria bacterium]|nr:cation transporter [Gammaproteobacteria bacterium]